MRLIITPTIDESEPTRRKDKEPLHFSETQLSCYDILRSRHGDLPLPDGIPACDDVDNQEAGPRNQDDFLDLSQPRRVYKLITSQTGQAYRVSDLPVLRILDQLRERKEQTSSIILSLDRIQEDIEGLSTARSVTCNALRDVKEECQPLREEYDYLSEKLEGLQSRLRHFKVFEKAERIIGGAGSLRTSGRGHKSVVMLKEYSEMLREIDRSLAFIRGHSDYHDAPLFSTRFRQTLINALVQIRSQFQHRVHSVSPWPVISSVDRFVTGVEWLAQAKEVDIEYKRAQSAVGEFGRLVKEIDMRKDLVGEEGRSIYQACLASFLEARSRVVAAIVGKLIEDCERVFEERKHLVAYVSCVTECMRYIASHEQELLLSVFNEQDLPRLAPTLSSAGSEMELYLRPRIARETSIPGLSTACRALRGLLNTSDAQDTATKQAFVKGSAVLSEVMDEVLKDLQRMLVFRVEAAVSTTINAFSFTREMIMEDQRGRLILTTVPEEYESFDLFSEVQKRVGVTIQYLGSDRKWQSTYPPVRRMTIFLFDLFGNTPAVSYNELSFDIFVATLTSLSKGRPVFEEFSSISSRLYILSQYLVVQEVVREMAVGGDERRDPAEMEGSGYLGFLSPNKIWNFVSGIEGDTAPRESITAQDWTSAIIEQQEKELVKNVVGLSVDALSSFMLNVGTFGVTAPEGLDLTDQSFASPERLGSIYNCFQAELQMHVTRFSRVSRLYLFPKNYLVEAIRDEISAAYGDFWDLVSGKYGKEVWAGWATEKEMGERVMRLVGEASGAETTQKQEGKQV